jgi:hypothetical protein|tara:strand:+ start:3221 stop:3541 length:321 start_codon:yes stop_codon:yes gene_type:complete
MREANAFETKGQIKMIGEVQEFASGFYKQDIVITTEDKYPQDVKFSVLKEKGEQLKGMTEGDTVIVSFNVKGREYNDKYYVDLEAWKIAKAEPSTKAEVEANDVPF